MTTSIRKFSRREPLLTLERFKQLYLFGVDLTDSNGNAMSDEALQSAIDFGIATVENTIQCPIIPTDYDERLDFYLAETQKDMYLQLPIYPIVNVTKICLALGGNVSADPTQTENVLDFPEAWWIVHNQMGQIQMSPNFTTLNAFIFKHSVLINPIYSTRKFIPGGWRIQYQAGMADSQNNVDPIINRCIGIAAVIMVLRVIGDIGPGGSAGIASQSLSLDGLSSAVSTAISATSNLYDASVAHYIKELDQYTKVLKMTYSRINFTVA
jgi:hypothetical protein